MTDRLVLQEERHYCRIVWFLEQEGEYGGALGQSPDDGTGPAPTDREEYSHWLGSKTALESGAKRDTIGFYWESDKEARAALRQIREALKQDRPLPEWAKTALAAGWKPPKGWKA